MNHLLQAILDNPGDDGLRLVYADWLEEQGEAAQAEFIRDCVWMAANHTDCPTRLRDLKAGRPVPLRCGICDYCTRRRRAEKWYATHPWMIDGPNYAVAFEPTPLDGDMPTGPGLTLIVRRGFVDEVRCRLSDWTGGVCQRCGGRWRGVFGKGGAGGQTCPDCHGTGTVGDHGAAIVRAQPVTRVVTEKRPYHFQHVVAPGPFMWQFYNGDGRGDAGHRLPLDLMELVAVQPLCVESGKMHGDGWTQFNAYFHTEADALAALSAALLAWARGVVAKTATMV